MADLDLTELRRQIDAASPKNGPGRVVKLERGYAKAILAELEASRSPPVPTMQQIFDYLRGIDDLKRQVIEHQARRMAVQIVEPSDG